MADNELFGNSEQLEKDHVADPGNMVGDTISRAAAINAICEDGTRLERQGKYTMTMAERKQRDADILDALPYAQPTDEDIQRMQDIEQAMLEKAYWFGKQDAQQWIPVSERLPESYTDVLVWFEYYRYGDYNRLYQMHGIGTYIKEYDSWMINHETGWGKLRVFAWMPLPSPWEGGEE